MKKLTGSQLLQIFSEIQPIVKQFTISEIMQYSNLGMDSKLATVKAVKDIRGITLKEAKDQVDEYFAKNSAETTFEIKSIY